MKKAFTLIELLVVIAIIAILAAILFPVFAQAKAAAKKTAALSEVKQLGTSFAIYSSDADDLFPRAWGTYPGLGYMYLYAHDVPADWYPGTGPIYKEFANGSWANSTMPYTKSQDLLTATGEKEVNEFGDNFSVAVKKIGKIGFTMNGLLNTFSGSSVASPSKLTLLSMARGAINDLGYAFSSPIMVCDYPDQPCVYTPPRDGCDGSRNGELSGQLYSTIEPSMWSYGYGGPAVMTDSSAHFVRLGMNTTGNTDYHTDYYNHYDKSGVPKDEWYEAKGCHSFLFRPDFDFNTTDSALTTNYQ